MTGSTHLVRWSHSHAFKLCFQNGTLWWEAQLDRIYCLSPLPPFSAPQYWLQLQQRLPSSLKMLQTSSELRTAGFTAVAWQPHVHTAPHGVLAGKCQTEEKVRSRALSWLIKRLITLSVLYQVSNSLPSHDILIGLSQYACCETYFPGSGFHSPMKLCFWLIWIVFSVFFLFFSFKQQLLLWLFP